MAVLDEKIKEKYLKAGRIAAEARDYGASLIKEGTSLLQVTEAVEKKVIELGGEFAFPPQISLNEIAAHYCAEQSDAILFKKGDLVKIDVGVMIDGYIGDTAVTVNLGEHSKLLEASREALNNAIKKVRPGVTVSEIGRTIHDTIVSYGFSPVKNLSGHGLNQYVFHDRPSIPNFDTGDKTKLEKGMVIAIEPFASMGAGVIYESGQGNIFSQVGKKPVRNTMTRDVLKEIENYRAMPFTTRWLARKFPLPKVNFALRELLQLGVIRSYPPLPDMGKGFISQAEHTMIVDDEVIVTTRV
jgi:methionyl aminopeptidase